MSLHKAFNSLSPELAAQAAEMTLNPQMPVEVSHSMRVIEDYECFQGIVDTLQARYVEIAESQGVGEDYAQAMLVGSLVALNTLARCAEITELQASFDV